MRFLSSVLVCGAIVFSSTQSFAATGEVAEVAVLADFYGSPSKKRAMPVLMSATSFTSFPNELKSKLKMCIFTGQGWGDFESERVKIRIELLNCVLKNHKALEVKVLGHVTGEDGNMGLRGKEVTNLVAIEILKGQVGKVFIDKGEAEKYFRKLSILSKD